MIECANNIYAGPNLKMRTPAGERTSHPEQTVHSERGNGTRGRMPPRPIDLKPGTRQVAGWMAEAMERAGRARRHGSPIPIDRWTGPDRTRHRRAQAQAQCNALRDTSS